MKTFLSLTFAVALALLAEANVENLASRNVFMPVNPSYTAEEWKNIMAAQKQSPEFYPNFKKGSEPQPDFAGKVHVHVGNSRITNGKTASRGQFPWQVGFIIDNQYFCGGSVISNQWILTAGHCYGNSYQVILGANSVNNPESGSVVVSTRTSIQHENYNEKTANNDIAVIKLNSPVQYTTYISPVKLPSRSQQGNTYVGSVVRVSGWGQTSDSNPNIASSLQYVDLTVITNTVCAQSYGSVITSTKLCCSTPGAKSTCSGDSGGPLVIQGSDGAYTEIGIVSFGAQDGCELEIPIAFTRVTSYLDWIESNTGISIN